MTPPLPPGWAAHPQSPEYMYEVANPQNVHPIQAPAAPVAPAAPPTPPAAPPGAAVVPFGGPVDTGLIDQELAGLGTFEGGNTIYLDFPSLNRAGDEANLVVWLLPRWNADVKFPWVKLMRHFIYSRYVPGDQKGDKTTVACFDSPGGPGTCDVCAALEQLATMATEDRISEAVKRFKASKNYRWQALDMTEPQKHWVQVSGQYIVKPGLVNPRTRLQRAILNVWKHSGDPTNPNGGYPLVLTKRKTGPKDTDVEYHALPQDKQALDPSFHPVLSNLIDLSATQVFKDRAVMREIASNLMREFGAGNTTVAPAPVPGWPVAPAAPVAPPPAPPAAAPPVWAPPAAPAAAPPAAPPPAPPPGPPPGAPVAAPWTPPQAAAPAAPAYPPGPPVGAPPWPAAAPPGPPAPPAYGAPPGVPPGPPAAPPAWAPPAGQPPAVPGPPAGAPGAMSPDDLERALAGAGGGSGIPF